MTDITNNPNDRSGDWQQGSNIGAAPNEIFGTWKGAVRTTNHAGASQIRFGVVGRRGRHRAAVRGDFGTRGHA